MEKLSYDVCGSRCHHENTWTSIKSLLKPFALRVRRAITEQVYLHHGANENYDSGTQSF